MTAVVTVEAVVLVLLSLLVAGLLRSHAEILRRLEAPATPAPPRPATAPGSEVVAPARVDGTPAPDVVGTTLDGDALKLAPSAARTGTLLAFLSSGCLSCEAVWTALRAGGDAELADRARVVIVTKDRSLERPAALRDVAPASIPVVMSSRAWEDYQVPVSPYFVYVDGASGTIHGEGAAERWEQIVSLLRDALAEEAGAGRPRGGAGRVLRADLELRAAGIADGHASLYAPDDPGHGNGGPGGGPA